MRIDTKEKVWFVNKKEERSIQRVNAMLSAICVEYLCSDCPLKRDGACIKSLFYRRVVRRAVAEKEKKK